MEVCVEQEKSHSIDREEIESQVKRFLYKTQHSITPNTSIDPYHFEFGLSTCILSIRLCEVTGIFIVIVNINTKACHHQPTRTV